MMFKLGDIVRVREKLVRTYHNGGRYSWERQALKKPIDGIYVGYRFKQEGRIIYGYGEEQNSFTRTGTIKVALVATNLHTNPMIVPFDALE